MHMSYLYAPDFPLKNFCKLAKKKKKKRKKTDFDSTSFSGSLILPPGAMRDPGNEVDFGYD